MSPDTAARIARGWTRVYTAFVPPTARTARRAEIESDLWESVRDPDMARDILPRLLLGIADDLSWSVEHMDTTERGSAWWSLGLLVTLAVSWIWISRAPESAAMRESLFAFPAAITFHLLGLVCLVGVRGALDLRLIGRAFTDVPVSTLVRRFAPFTVVSALVTVVSGMLLYMADPARMLGNVMFRVKLVALLLILVDVWFMHAIALRRVPEWDSAAEPPLAARAAAYVSLTLWVALIVIGKLIPFDIFH